MRWPVPALLLILFAASCGTHRGVVQEGRFEKRTHQRGWHIDLHGRGRDDAREKGLSGRLPSRAVSMDRRVADPRQRVLACKDPVMAGALPRTSILPLSGRTTPVPMEITTGAVPREPTIRQDGDENVVPRKEWNKLAVPAFVLALLTVAAGFTLTHVGVVALAVLATIIVAAVSLKQIRRREQAGKGFALIALIIGLIAALFTALVVLWAAT